MNSETSVDQPVDEVVSGICQGEGVAASRKRSAVVPTAEKRLIQRMWAIMKHHVAKGRDPERRADAEKALMVYKRLIRSDKRAFRQQFRENGHGELAGSFKFARNFEHLAGPSGRVEMNIRLASSQFL